MRKCKRTKKKKICVIVLAAVIITAGWKIHSVAPILPFSPEYEEGASSRTAVLPEGSVDLKDLYSPYAVLVDVESGNVLAGQKAEKKIYPASLTKIMTAVLAIENTDDMSQTVTLPYEIFEPLYAENASMAGFQPGEEVTLKDLLYGILLPS